MRDLVIDCIQRSKWYDRLRDEGEAPILYLLTNEELLEIYTKIS